MSEGLVLAGRYRLISKLGTGGMGSVWRAWDLTLKAEIAIKLIDPSLSDSTEARGRFQREAEAAAAIRSTHVVQIMDYGVDNGLPYIAMELLHGENLARRLTRVGRMAPRDASHILNHVARALSLAHERGITHRDLKPENIFIVREVEEDIAKVLDFGIARRDNRLTESVGPKTQTGALLGTPYYMSPEQATGQHVDQLSDIWSFGIIAYECLTGKRAFDGDTLGGLFYAVCIAKMPVPSSNQSVPRGFNDWFARAAARKRTERYQSIREAADALRAVCSSADIDESFAASVGTTESSRFENSSVSTFGLSVPPSSMTIPGLKTRGPWRWILVGAGVLAVGTAVAVYFASANKSTANLGLKQTATAFVSDQAQTESVVLVSPPQVSTPLGAPSQSSSIQPSAPPRSESMPAPSAFVKSPKKAVPMLQTRTKPREDPATDADNVAAF
jgi:eukaryotic-like serine/threonine-protein kinase